MLGCPVSAVEERYVRAMSSSHLEWSRTEQTALDVIIAAGLPIRDRHGNIIPDTLGSLLMRLRAEFDNLGRDHGVLRHLRSAGEVRLRLVALIQDRGGIPAECIDMAAKLMDQWCDPSCPTCTGRGVVGEYGSPQMICQPCGGSKRRTLFWSQDQQRLADAIAAEMESKVDSAQRRIRKLLRQE